MNEKIKINFLEPIRWHLFSYMREKKYIYGKADLCKEIQRFLIKYYNLETRVSENSSISLLDNKLEDEYLDTSKYKKEACGVYQNLQIELNFFRDRNMNREKYKDNLDIYTDNDRKKYFLNSLYIVRSEIEKIEEIFPDLYDEMDIHLKRTEDQIKSIDRHQDKESQYLNYIQVLRESKTNYIIQRYDGIKFYPIIVDMYLDYVAIMDNLKVYENDLKKKTKNYKKFRKDILDKNNNSISSLYFYFVNFKKTVRSNQVKKFVLKKYLGHLDYNENVNILFRKLYLADLDTNTISFRPKDMSNFNPQIHMIFVFAANFKHFFPKFEL
ncbi:MAG: hypothetical protein COB07_11765 [Sulfurovum sp.]|nr:MAG: hypothetical protein COB07_11765 [Sulfurovum sp.]